MLFELTNVLGTFCSLMNTKPYIDYYNLDDIIIYNNYLGENLGHLGLVFVKLREHKLYLKRDKCLFTQVQVSFIVHFIKKGNKSSEYKGYSGLASDNQS